MSDRLLLLGKPANYYVSMFGITGHFPAALMLSELLWGTKWVSERDPDRDGWVWQSAKDWNVKYGLSRHHVQLGKAKLIELGLVETVVRKVGGLAVVHYKVNLKQLDAALLEFRKAQETQDVDEEGQAANQDCRFSETQETGETECRKPVKGKAGNRTSLLSTVDSSVKQTQHPPPPRSHKLASSCDENENLNVKEPPRTTPPLSVGTPPPKPTTRHILPSDPDEQPDLPLEEPNGEDPYQETPLPGKARLRGRQLARRVDPVVREIYLAYPRKVAPAAAEKAIGKALKLIPADQLKAMVAEYARCVGEWPEDRRQFVPHPATWFNARRWEEDPAEWVHREMPTRNGGGVMREKMDMDLYRSIKGRFTCHTDWKDPDRAEDRKTMDALERRYPHFKQL